MKHFVLVDKNENILSSSFIDSDDYTMSKEFHPNCVIFDERFYKLMIEKCPVLKDGETEEDIILSDLSKREIRMIENADNNIITWETELKKVKPCPQRQDSMIDQLFDLIEIASKFGFEDASKQLKKVCDKHQKTSFNLGDDFVPAYKIELDKVSQCPVSEYDTIIQLKHLWGIANKFGLYDAADYIK